MCLLVESKDAVQPLVQLCSFFSSTAPPVALHLTVVQLPCHANGGPNILLLACFHTTPGGPSWPPQPQAAPRGTVLPEAQRARAIAVSMRRRHNGSSVTRVTKPSAPAPAPSSLGCAPRQRPWCSS